MTKDTQIKNMKANRGTKAFGQKAEAVACHYLLEQGLSVVAKNWSKHRVGEIDLVMLDKQTLVFVEVRYRKSDKYGGAAASITALKQQKIVNTAAYFLQEHPEYEQFECRFDVIALCGSLSSEQLIGSGVDNDKLTWIPAAFSA